MKHSSILLVVVLLLACPGARRDPVTPTPLSTDYENCTAMCDHLATLGCEEGKSVYDSDRPGPQGEPNTTCAEFCITSQQRGADLYPFCVAKAPSCELIESYRVQSCP